MKPPSRYSVEGTVAAVLFIVLIAVVLVQILGRTPVLRGPVWTEEVARWIWVWMAFIGIAEVERQDGQLKMAFLADLLPAKVRLVLYTLIDVVFLGLVGHLIWISYKTVLRTSNNISVTLPTTDAVLYASALIGFVLILYRILRRIFGRRDVTVTREPTL
ncbi:TRAP transporter small permease [Thalassorhabdomicrobium marinisediminis]|uniref:TRAP transporter small permease n=1 Tax=Thalassorhabdomicrobium marinisediminis TaxID=2170577 RepID=UPI00248F7534|nr:TRAP transporter small permease [Thalassorhabdomicrobium marinisediminis]